MTIDLRGGLRPALLSTLGLLAALAVSGCGTSGPCPLGTTECGEGVCAVLESDQDNCGACGTVCPGGQVCNGAGQCAAECLQGFAVCDGVCTDPMTSQDFCGAGPDCTGGTACAAGEVCAGGTCAETCQAGFVLCDGRCVDTSISRSFCGATRTCLGMFSGVACEPGEVCTGGVCALECQPGQIVCGGQCTDPQISNAFCGASGSCEGAESGEACVSGSICSAGRCRATCQPGQIECGGRCADPLTDNVFCGAEGDCTGESMGESCAPGTICSEGACGVTCLSGSIECGGRCVDTSLDRAFCGASDDCQGENIGVECTSGQVCVDGVCDLSCPALQVECDGRCVDPRTDVLYCGASGDCLGENVGVQCPPGNLCSSRECVVTCQEELVQCGEACIDPLNDRTFCGASVDCLGDNAGTACQEEEICLDGECTAQPCPDGLLGCGVFCVEPDSDPFFCGASGDCDGANGGTLCARREACVDGVCTGVAVPDFLIGLFDPTSKGSFSAAGARRTATSIGRIGGIRNNAYFTFDLSSLSGTEVVSAYLRMTVARFSSADDEETISAWDVTTDADDLARPVGARPDIFGDLGGGFRYAVKVVDRTDLNTEIEIDLRGPAFQDVLDAFGGTFSVGVTHNSPGSGSGDEVVEFSQGFETRVNQLAVEYVPTP